jgi:hypothetical protein
MEGFSAWSIRDIFIIAALIFNAGGVFYLIRSHMKYVREALARLESSIDSIIADITSIKTDVAVLQKIDIGSIRTDIAVLQDRERMRGVERRLSE